MESACLGPFPLFKALETSVSRWKEIWCGKWPLGDGDWFRRNMSSDQYGGLFAGERHLLLLVQPPGGFWEEKRSTGIAGHVIYDESVSSKVMWLGWRILQDNEKNFLLDQKLDSQKWNKCSMTSNLIQAHDWYFQESTFRHIKLFQSLKSLELCSFFDKWHNLTETKRQGGKYWEAPPFIKNSQ